jgi:DNA-directed RNA polymerase III subunit RPC2
MERDCLLSYGSSALMMERLMISSDLYSVYVCEKCGFIKFSAECKVCNTTKVFKVVLPYACKLLF